MTQNSCGEVSELAKGHAWKACKAERPRGFESRSLRHNEFLSLLC